MPNRLKTPDSLPLMFLATAMLGLILAFGLCLPVLAHETERPWPSVLFTTDSTYQAGETVSITAFAQNADSVSWRLFRNGRAVDASLSDNGGAFSVELPGDYILRAVARHGELTTTHTESFQVLPDGESGAYPASLSLSLPYSIYSVSGTIQPIVASAGVISIDWSLLKNGAPEPLPDGFGAGSSISPTGPGEYELTATAYGGDGSTVMRTVAFTVVSDPDLELTMDTIAYAGEPFEVHLSASGIPDTHIKWVLKHGESEKVLPGLTSSGGMITIMEPGIYSIYVRGYDAAYQVRASAAEDLVVVERSDEDVLAGSTSHGINRRSIYSWSSTYIRPEKESVVHEVMETLDCDTIYQDFSTDNTVEEILNYLDRRDADGHRVYYLCGDSSWANETDAASMLRELYHVIEINEAAQEAGIAKIYGIQYDVERLNTTERMNQVVENYKIVYEVAKAHDIKVEACIDYRLDSEYGFYDQLEDLVANGCDSLAIMNYYKRNSEARHIQYEVALCGQYGKDLVNITEMQPVGSHGLTEDNTYYNDGIEAVEKMWRGLDSVFDHEIGFSYHYLNTLIELLGLEA